MGLKLTIKTFQMAGETHQLEEIIQKAAAAESGETILFPEYGAYTPEGSRTARMELSRLAAQQGVSIITSLNMPGDDLPHAGSKVNYNTLFVFSRTGRIYTPQAKITPQSFEMRHEDASSPKMNVAPYSHLNRVTFRQEGQYQTAYFLICSDLYVLQSFNAESLRANALICPANFGNGAEGSAGKVIEYWVKTGVFDQGFLCNTWQKVKQGQTPLSLAVEKTFEEKGNEKLPFNKERMRKILDQSSVVYPDEEYRNFQDMLKLTRNGTFTVPRSRSLECGLNVQLGVYEKTIEL